MDTSKSYDPSGNALGEVDAKIANSARGLPDQFQGRYSHLVIKRLPPAFSEKFSLRPIKENSTLDAEFESYRAANPHVEKHLEDQAVRQTVVEQLS